MNNQKLKCVILGAGAPHIGNQPALLEQVGGISVLDWLLDSLSLPDCSIDLILGYQSEEITSRYKNVDVLVNTEWQATGSTFSLFHSNLDDVDDLLVCYGDVLYRKQLVSLLQSTNSPIVVAWDSRWKQRYLGRDLGDLQTSEKVIARNHILHRLGPDLPVDWADGEFIGVVRFSGPALDALRQLQQDKPEFLKEQHLSGLVEWMRVSGLPVTGHDVAGDWAEVNHPRDIAHFVLGTKAETLSRLRNVITSATIQDQVSFTAIFWEQEAAAVIEQIRNKFAGQSLVVRSSARSEDAFTHSNAGAYTSLLNVDPAHGLEDAIKEVLASYQDQQSEDQVLVQPMVQDVTMSGVAFTRTLEKAAPYLVINYEESGSTDGITSGHAQSHKTLYVRRDAEIEQVADSRLVPLVKALKEIERLLAYDALDVEFAVDAAGEVYILQVRPIAVELVQDTDTSNEVFEQLAQAEADYQKLQQPPPHLFGKQPVYGIMPDWNPAEIIGTHPNNLASSLYSYLILDETWATQRAEYGYRDVRPHGLLISFAGKPYIDVRASFNSFIPATVCAPLAEKLVNFYLDWLCKHPELHDKVEFEVVPTCLGLNFSRWEKRLSEAAQLTPAELSELHAGLKQITINAIRRTPADLAFLPRLEKRFNTLRQQAKSSNQSTLIQQVWLLLEDCRLLGTLPFSHLARSGFVAVTLLKEGLATGVLTEAARDDFMASLYTVSHELGDDARMTAEGNMVCSAFVEKYGHLRPGTYDITSNAYRDDPENYLRPLLSTAHEVTMHKERGRWAQEKSAFFNALRQQGLAFTDEVLEAFLRTAIEGREKAKFVFSRNLSLALDLLVRWGDIYGLDRVTLAHLEINELLALRHQPTITKEAIEQLKSAAKLAMKKRTVFMACELPALITSQQDFYSFIQQAGQPNFIGNCSIQAACINLADTGPEEQPEVEGCLVMIPQADPGYDWLFGKGIAGLITMYGGANSHMAIRAAEFALPAAIGIGEQLYKDLSKGRTLELDPVNGSIKVLN